MAVLLFWKEQKNQRKRDEDELKRIKIRCYITIEKELDDHLEALNSSDYDIIQDNENFPFRSLFLNVDAYTSLLNSGLFTHFPNLTQLALANLYMRIKVHNEYQVQRSVLKGNFQIHGSWNRRMDWSLISLEGDKILSRYQKEILDITEDLINLIEVEKSNLTSRKLSENRRSVVRTLCLNSVRNASMIEASNSIFLYCNSQIFVTALPF